MFFIQMSVILLIGGQFSQSFGGYLVSSRDFFPEICQDLDLSSPSSSQNESLPGTYENGDFINSNGFTTVTEENSTSRFYFPNNNTLAITTLSQALLSYHFTFGIENSNLSLNIDTLETISIDLEKNLNLGNTPRLSVESSSSISFSWTYGTLIKISIPLIPYEEMQVDQSSMQLSIENFLSLYPTLHASDIYPAVGDASRANWDLFSFDSSAMVVEIPFSRYNGEESEDTGQKTLIFTLFNTPIVTSPVITEEPDSPDIPFVPLIIGLAVVLVISLALSSENYRTLVIRTINPNHGMHRLGFGEIFENENRMKIINAVLAEPGIHFNELKRQCNLQTGQLRWHINLLESYGILQMHKIGQYNTYFPTISENPITEADIPIIKSKSTLKILKMIEDVPGITASRIAKILGLGRNTVKYHIDKLIEKKLVSTTKDGRQLRLARINKKPFSQEEKG